MLDRASSDSQPRQLAPRDERSLSGRDLRDQPIGPADDLRNTTRGTSPRERVVFTISHMGNTTRLLGGGSRVVIPGCVVALSGGHRSQNPTRIRRTP
jgi:hypothetical protein